MPLGIPRKAMALLGRLLEMLKPTAGHSPNPRVGLPVDELDCSRQLAHVFLFEHDKVITSQLDSGEDRYVRWMDDQNIGAASMTEARKIINDLTRSLQTQRLTLNSGKTKFLTPDKVLVHFHLEVNEELTNWYDKYKKTFSIHKVAARKELKKIWESALVHEDIGNWDKVLKRFYAYVVPCNASFLDKRAIQDLIENPGIAARIFDSFAKLSIPIPTGR